MSWYYAGPDATPVGPVSLEELRARRASGVILPETYVIEDAGPPHEQRAWRRYNEVFPVRPPLPPLPSTLPPPPPPYFPPAGGHAAVRKTNPWCAWGFGMALLSLPLLFLCIGMVLAPVAGMVSFIGLAQVYQRPGQSGRGLAIGGLLISALAVLITLIFLAWAIPTAIKQHEQTTSEESSSDTQ